MNALFKRMAITLVIMALGAFLWATNIERQHYTILNIAAVVMGLVLEWTALITYIYWGLKHTESESK